MSSGRERLVLGPSGLPPIDAGASLTLLTAVSSSASRSSDMATSSMAYDEQLVDLDNSVGGGIA